MSFRCGLCMVSPSRDGFEGSREDVVAHLRNHGEHGVREESIETYLCKIRGEQATLTEVSSAP